MGNGRNGRVSKNDLLRYLENRQKAPAASHTVESVPVAKAAASSSSPNAREVVIPVSTMRRVIMENMVASRAISAHVDYFL